jgi:hypothetical protein
MLNNCKLLYLTLAPFITTSTTTLGIFAGLTVDKCSDRTKSPQYNIAKNAIMYGVSGAIIGATFPISLPAIIIYTVKQ